MSTKSVGELIDNVAQTVTVVLVSLMIAVVGLNVFCRYFIGFSWAWGEELPRYSMVWIAFLGGSVGVKQGQMMAVNYLVDRIPYSIRCFVIVVSLLSSCTFLAFAIFYGILITGITYKQVSPALRFPMSYAYVVVPLGCSIMLYHILTQLVEVLKKKRAKIPVESQEIEDFSFRKNKQN